jgi:hypothetical protein
MARKNIKTPEIMWEHFQKYRKQTKSRKRIIQKATGRGVMNQEMEIPLTIEGFSNWLFENNITSNLHDYLANTRGAYDNFSSICKRIREIVRQDQIEGGMCGQYNPSITQRLNNLVDKQETVIKEQALFGDDE